jgi:hypothetical protein
MANTTMAFCSRVVFKDSSAALQSKRHLLYWSGIRRSGLMKEYFSRAIENTSVFIMQVTRLYVLFCLPKKEPPPADGQEKRAPEIPTFQTGRDDTPISGGFPD